MHFDFRCITSSYNKNNAPHSKNKSKRYVYISTEACLRSLWSYEQWFIISSGLGLNPDES